MKIVRSLLSLGLGLVALSGARAYSAALSGARAYSAETSKLDKPLFELLRVMNAERSVYFALELIHPDLTESTPVRDVMTKEFFFRALSADPNLVPRGHAAKTLQAFARVMMLHGLPVNLTRRQIHLFSVDPENVLFRRLGDVPVALPREMRPREALEKYEWAGIWYVVNFLDYQKDGRSVLSRGLQTPMRGVSLKLATLIRRQVTAYVEDPLSFVALTACEKALRGFKVDVDEAEVL